MSNHPQRPRCFIAIPSGKHPPADGERLRIDFDAIREHIAAAAEAAGLEPARADFEPAGGFIEKWMIEQLIVAEYVIADLTLANRSVFYEVGVRHGTNAHTTLLLCADAFLAGLPFDVRSPQVIAYKLAESGVLLDDDAKKLRDEIRKRLSLARAGQLSVDNLITQVTAWKTSPVAHSKADVFLQRLEFTGALGERISAAKNTKSREAAIAVLAKIEAELIPLPSDVTQVYTALIGVFLAYREKKAYDRMVALFERFPKELQDAAIAREQCALALNRLAEQAYEQNNASQAEDLRRKALDLLDLIPSEDVTSETYGIRGRIYKGWHDAVAKSAAPADHDRASDTLQQAIRAYQNGFCQDLRDCYPGVNAVTLRLLRNEEEDRKELASLIPMVRFSVSVAPPPANKEEEYWQTATKLELATADRDWESAKQHLTHLLELDAQKWMFETTALNLNRQKQAFAADAEAVAQLKSIVAALQG
jgi:hypothetical protein